MRDTPQPHHDVAKQDQGPDTTLAIVVYVLHLLAIVSGGLTSLVGAVIAYVYRGSGPEWLDEHYRFQVRTFWMALLYFFIAGLLTLVLIGYVLWLLAVVWLVVRCAKGLRHLQQRRAPDNVDTWLF
ncbi:hypothetical protein HOP52_07005 [Halomonas campisalis]|uniref:Transmembrane protein n=1 Tax=Billgrantia campisalis TaxID=74661 RepID=A0ABS9P6W2_9GAMM|nr:DUF4870 domain-containing protein [Halomonas campisalis]MCG6657513.1 hypothetical protein [Halomonas campisalis]MDR5863140.1 hypothetical protein [Halomonas campisalis]